MVKSSEPLIGYQLKYAQSLLNRRMDDVLRPLGLTVPQYSCLYQLGSNPGISAAGLARVTFVSRQSTNALLQGLLDRGLVARPEHAEAGRALPVALTVSGQEILAQANDVVDGVQERMLSGLSPDELASFASALAACATALEDKRK